MHCLRKNRLRKAITLGFIALFAWNVPASAKVYQLGLVMAEREDRRIEGDILSAATSAFFESKRFIVIERAQLDKIFTERDLSDFITGSPGDLSNLEGVDMLGLVSYSVENGVPGAGQNYYIEVRLTDVKTGQIVGNVSSRRDTFSDPTTPHAAGRFLLQNIREMFPPEGYVVRISGDQVIVDLGEESGIQKGDTLEVIREDEEVIFHPVTGKPMPAQEKVVGTLKVVDPANQMSTCKMPKASGIFVADRVRLQPKNQTGAKIFKKLPFFKGKGH